MDPHTDPQRAARQRGGVVLRYSFDTDEGEEVELTFVPADVALRVVELSAETEVPGVQPPARGIGLVGAEVVTVIALGDPAPPIRTSYEPAADWPLPGSDRAVLCQVGAQRVALTGATIVATGCFDAIDESVVWRGALVPTLDVRALYAQAEAAIWAMRASPRPVTLGGEPAKPSLRPNSVRPASLRPPSVRNPATMKPKEDPK